MREVDERIAAGRRLEAEIRAHLTGETPSIRALALRSGTSATVIGQWWTKGTHPSAAVISRIAQALEVSSDRLQAAYDGRPYLTPQALSAETLDLLEERIRRAFREELADALRLVGRAPQ